MCFFPSLQKHCYGLIYNEDKEAKKKKKKMGSCLISQLSHALIRKTVTVQ